MAGAILESVLNSQHHYCRRVSDPAFWRAAGQSIAHHALLIHERVPCKRVVRVSLRIGTALLAAADDIEGERCLCKNQTRGSTRQRWRLKGGTFKECVYDMYFTVP